jgi:hypothetical protein
MNLWEDRAIKEVSAAFGQTSLFLRNALPNLLGSISSDEQTQLFSTVRRLSRAKDQKGWGPGPRDNRQHRAPWKSVQTVLAYDLI